MCTLENIYFKSLESYCNQKQNKPWAWRKLAQRESEKKICKILLKAQGLSDVTWIPVSHCRGLTHCCYHRARPIHRQEPSSVKWNMAYDYGVLPIEGKTSTSVCHREEISHIFLPYFIPCLKHLCAMSALWMEKYGPTKPRLFPVIPHKWHNSTLTSKSWFSWPYLPL